MKSILGCAFLSTLALTGCLSSSYEIRHDDLVELSKRPPDERWEGVRVVQNIGGGDDPPQDDAFVAYPADPDPSGGVYVNAVIVEPGPAHGRAPYAHATRPPLPRTPAQPRPAPSPAAPTAAAPSASASGASSGGGKAATASAGNGNDKAAVAIAAAVVVGAAAGIGIVATEGARYDGWIAVHPMEPLYLTLPTGGAQAVPLSQLTPELAASAVHATVYEGNTARFERLGRAPLDRAGFTFATALHFGGVPELGGRTGAGLGGALLLGGNIANAVTLGVRATAVGGLDTHGNVLLSTLAPEVEVFPLRLAGVYAGAGAAFRNSDIDGLRRADQGWLLRAGLVGEIPLTTRLTLNAHAGGARYVLDAESAPITWEGSIGLATY